MKKTLLMAAFLVSAAAVMADAVPAVIFQDNMVLQRQMPVPVWGKAAPGENVTVKFAGQTIKTQACKAGKWMVKLAAMQANAQGSELVIQGQNNTVTLKNVLVGEVWLASGQSNMEMPMWTDRPRWRATDGDKHIKAGANKLIRINKIKRNWAQLPEDTCVIETPWAELNEKNGADFSATAFYFAQKIYKDLQIPVGIVVSAWSGSGIDPFIAPEGYKTVPEFKEKLHEIKSKLPGTAEYKAASEKIIADYDKWLTEYKAAAAAGKLLPEPPVFPKQLKHYVHHQYPTVKYNSMIHPLLPFAFRGVIWYQGCSNRGEGMLYKSKMHALFNGWQQLFQQPDLAFYFVQLAPYNYGGNPYKLPEIWEAQQAFADCMPENVAMAVINDVGDYGDIHPHDKLTVGNRLGLLALKHTYKKNVKADSPTLKSWKVEGGKFILEFNNVEKFVSKGKIANFEVAGAAENWQKADAVADGNKLIVSSAKVQDPCKLRYMWHHTVTGNLYNEAELPLGAFRCGKEASQEAVIRDIEKNMQLIYQHDPRKATGADGSIKYQIDNSSKFSGKVKRVAYCWEVTGKDGKKEYVAAVMDTFSKDVKKIGVPVAAAKAKFAVKVQNVSVFSNVKDLATGNIGECNIEFWSNNYVPANTGVVPGANARKYDFCDTPQGAALGYGCMQLHNFKAKQTIFAYNAFRSPSPDLGFGNSTHRAEVTDWTFAKNAADYSSAGLKVYASFE